MDTGVKHTYLNVKDKREITLNGVINVEGFDESYVTLRTEEGKFIIEGSGLKIESLSKEDGVIVISGSFSGAFYSENKATKKLFSRLFG